MSRILDAASSNRDRGRPIRRFSGSARERVDAALRVADRRRLGRQVVPACDQLGDRAADRGVAHRARDDHAALEPRRRRAGARAHGALEQPGGHLRVARRGRARSTTRTHGTASRRQMASNAPSVVGASRLTRSSALRRPVVLPGPPEHRGEEARGRRAGRRVEARDPADRPRDEPRHDERRSPARRPSRSRAVRARPRQDQRIGQQGRPGRAPASATHRCAPTRSVSVDDGAATVAT